MLTFKAGTKRLFFWMQVCRFCLLFLLKYCHKIRLEICSWGLWVSVGFLFFVFCFPPKPLHIQVIFHEGSN